MIMQISSCLQSIAPARSIDTFAHIYRGVSAVPDTAKVGFSPAETTKQWSFQSLRYLYISMTQTADPCVDV